jgi:hypothetical protein
MVVGAAARILLCSTLLQISDGERHCYELSVDVLQGGIMIAAR